MARQKVFAALEIADRDVRLIVFEAFDGRYLILRSEQVPVSGIEGLRIVDERKVAEAIRQAVAKAQAALGYHIERVLLAIPSAQVTRISQTIHITIEDGTKTVRLFHIQQGIEKALAYKPEEPIVFVNINRIECSIDDRVFNRLPVGEETESFDMDIDLLYANRDIVYSYVRAVEEAGLEVLDIYVDAYAQAQETASFAHSRDATVIMVTVEARHTVLTLISDERILSSAVLDRGYESFVDPLKNQYGLSRKIADRLLLNLFSLDQENQDSIIYIEQQDDRRVEITARELASSILPNIRSWIADINEACEPITSTRKARYILTGPGSDFPILREMANAFSAPVSIYRQSAAGARKGAFAAALGMGYAWSESSVLKGNDQISVNGNELEASIESMSSKREEKNGFTMKLKRAMLAAGDSSDSTGDAD